MWPRRASRPTTPEPGATGRPSAPRTAVVSPTRNRGPAAGPSRSRTLPLWPVSEAPKLSMTITPGRSRRSSSLTAGDRMAPPDRQQRRGAVPGARGGEGIGEGAGHGVAHEADGVDPLLFDQAQGRHRI